MSDFKLKKCGGLDLSSNDLQLTSGADNIRQRFLIGARTYLGEWVGDINTGIPWIQEIFVKGYVGSQIEKVFYDYTLSIPGVVRVNSVKLSEVDRARRQVKIEIDAIIEGPESIYLVFDSSLVCEEEPVEQDPSLIEGLRIWFDAQDPENYEADASGITLQNKAGQGYAQSQGSVGVPLLVGASPINGHPAVRIDNDSASNNQLLSFAGTPAIRDVAGEGISIFIVYRREEKSTPADPDVSGLMGLNGISGGTREHYAINYNTQTFRSTLSFTSEIQGGAGVTALTGTSTLYNVPEVSEFLFPVPPAFLVAYRNQQEETVTGSFVQRLLDGDGVIGASYDNAGAVVNHFNGYIGEVLVYDRPLSNGDRAAVSSYLMTKWGITVPELESGPGYGYFAYSPSAWGL